MSYLLFTHGSNQCRGLKSTPLIEHAEVNCTGVLCIMVNGMESLHTAALLCRFNVIRITVGLYIIRKRIGQCRPFYPV